LNWHIAEFNQKFAIQPTQKGTAFRRSGRNDLDWVFSIPERTRGGQDNTVAIKDRWWQIGKCRWRHTLAARGETGCFHAATIVI
jgi:hypothetical protein